MHGYFYGLQVSKCADSQCLEIVKKIFRFQLADIKHTFKNDDNLG